MPYFILSAVYSSLLLYFLFQTKVLACKYRAMISVSSQLFSCTLNTWLCLQECLKGILKNKTVILVTHQVDFLQNVDTVFVSLLFELSIYFEEI